jgi:hypothetical protein
MAFVRDLLERLRHPGVRPRDPAHTLSGRIDELWEQEAQSHRRQRGQSREEPGWPKLHRSKRKTPKREPAPSQDAGLVVEGEAGRRWVPRS